MTTALLLSLGGNMGDRRALMDSAVAAIGALPGTTVVARSAAYRSAADGPVRQDWYANLALVVETDMVPEAFIAATRVIEADLGRDRATEIPWGPRPMDIDVVALGPGPSARFVAPRPGKLLDTRPFVVIPLAEIAGDVSVGGRTIAAIAAQSDSGALDRLDWPVVLG